MKSSVFLFSITTYFLLSLICEAQTQFQRTISGTGDEEAHSITRTADGGYAIAGFTNSFGAGGYDVYVVKLDANGSLQWSRTVGGTGNDYGYSIIQATEGGYAVAGYTNSFGAGGTDVYIVKLDGSGALQWARTVGTTDYDNGYSIIQHTDGGYVVAGSTLSGARTYVVKIDPGGSVQWSTITATNLYARGYSIVQSADGGYAVAGSLSSAPSSALIEKLDSSLVPQWTRYMSASSSVYFFSVIQTADGGYAAAGGNWHTFFFVKFEANGTLQWSRTPDFQSYGSTAYSIIRTTDGGYVAAGYTWGIGNDDVCIVKFDGIGTVRWGRTLGGANADHAYSVVEAPDGGYVVAGSTSSFGAGGSDFFIVKLDSGGNTCGNMSAASNFFGGGNYVSSLNSTAGSINSSVSNPLSTASIGGILTLVCITGIQPISNEIPNSYELYQNYPNPFNPTTNIRFALPKSSFAKLTVYDILGREAETIVNEHLNAGTYEVEWNASNYPSGVYYYKLVVSGANPLSSGDYVEAKKMTLLK